MMRRGPAWILATNEGYYVTPACAGAFKAQHFRDRRAAIAYAYSVWREPPEPPLLTRRKVVVGGKGVRKRML